MKELMKTAGWSKDSYNKLGITKWEKPFLDYESKIHNSNHTPKKGTMYVEFNKKQSTFIEAIVDVKYDDGSVKRLLHAQWSPSSSKDHLLTGLMLNGERQDVRNSLMDRKAFELFKQSIKDAKKVSSKIFGLLNKNISSENKNTSLPKNNI